MTREEKNLLLKDLCGRLPYGFTIYRLSDNANIKINDIDDFAHFLEYSDGEEFKPYLRSMSSMTGEEKSVWYSFMEKYQGFPDDTIHFNKINEYQDWLNEHHFDYHGLIKKGLALESTEDMYD